MRIKLTLHPAGVVEHEIQHGLLFDLTALGAGPSFTVLASAEQTFEYQSRIRFCRHGRGWRTPGSNVLVSARVIRITRRRSSCMVARKFERWKTGQVPDLLSK